MANTARKLVTAAGGNGTAVQVLDHPLTRAQYAEVGRKLGISMEDLGAEQAGFLVPSQKHFEMAGGEFCGNATRSAATLLYELNGQTDQSFTVSGFNGTVSAHVEPLGAAKFRVSSTFPGMSVDVSDVRLSSGQTATVVDLGGIVHVCVQAKFPEAVNQYRAAHRTIMSELGLATREAVGVVWYERQDDTVKIHPVVWVRDVDTFYYESSCGSGTIAIGRVTGAHDVVQPTGQAISVDITNNGVKLESEMEIVR
jgi:diaminopimelate epimerase